MSNRQRHQYELMLKDHATTDVADRYRQPTTADLDLLAGLMLDAYVGTIDYDGEAFAEARQEVESYLSRRPLLNHSVVYAAPDAIPSACLVSELEGDRTALIAYIMTARAWKMQGLARQALIGALNSLSHAGFERVLATITKGNTATEYLFVSVGFRRLAPTLR